MTGRSFGKDYRRVKEWKMLEKISIKVAQFEGRDHKIGCQFATQERNLLFC